MAGVHFERGVSMPLNQSVLGCKSNVERRISVPRILQRRVSFLRLDGYEHRPTDTGVS